MKYVVIEIQKGEDGTIANLVTAHNNLNEAWSKYHGVLSAAAISRLPSHAAVLMEENGTPIAHECYTVEPEPEPNTEEAANES